MKLKRRWNVDHEELGLSYVLKLCSAKFLSTFMCLCEEQETGHQLFIYSDELKAVSV